MENEMKIVCFNGKTIGFDSRTYIVRRVLSEPKPYVGYIESWRIDSIGCPKALEELNPALVGRE